MTELRTPYGSFDLGTDFILSLVEKNNGLDWGNDFNLERSYPATLPWTNNNAQIWRQADTPESTDEMLSMPCDLVVDGNTEFRGTVHLLNTVEKTSYTITLTYNREILNPETLISEIDFGSVSTFDDDPEQFNYLWDDTISTIVNGKYGTCPYAMPMCWHKHFTYDIFNHWQTSTQQYYDSRQLIPMFYLGYILERIAQIWGLEFEGSFKSDEELKKLIIYNLYAPAYNPIIPTAGNTIRTQLPLEIKYHLPPITISHLLKVVRIRFACGVYFDVAHGKLNIYTMRDVFEPGRETDVTDYIKEFRRQDINTDTSAPTFKQKFDEHDDLIKYILDDRSKNYKGSVATEIVLLYSIFGQQTGDVYFVEDQDYYYEWNGSSWAKYQFRYFAYRLGESAEITDESCSVITTLKQDVINGVMLRLPESDYGKENFENNRVEYGLRLLLYHGLQLSNPIYNVYYPYASIDNISSEPAVIGEMELRDDGEYGQYERYKKYRVNTTSTAKQPRMVLKECSGIMDKLTPDRLLRIHSQLYLWTEKTRNYDIHGLVDVELRTIKI